ncbi:hypothetical protein Poli38472_001639 [Pythium oligandrum]|uniref:Complex 1 LYR protein domain-containing protein n=1 Tax=Pythium oligandrum TaxID=41045 RepID=A0A8K1CV25_PYTOL|nr:hypothetical protein Poli38472_001639 [Pythium oligandrum]|eukprot:TMW69483.1 hypothetical protein Poli38472_001639 [Pythium oligandrum]
MAALSLYRRILRVARTWEGGDVERAWIRTEARQRFEENRKIRDPKRIQQLIQEGHDQVDVAVHYKNPYPRPQYVDPGTVGGDNDFRRRSTRKNTKLDRTSRSRISRQYKPH